MTNGISSKLDLSLYFRGNSFKSVAVASQLERGDGGINGKLLDFRKDTLYFLNHPAALLMKRLVLLKFNGIRISKGITECFKTKLLVPGKVVKYIFGLSDLRMK